MAKTVELTNKELSTISFALTYFMDMDAIKANKELFDDVHDLFVKIDKIEREG